ncbi:hypothetical protein C8R43DRAFT_704910 [Mycena crocata]|nr:hypothetical protein C8R43DRAFT_704910 [Mycena crocata]
MVHIAESYYITVVFDLAGVKTQEARLVFSLIAVAIGAFGALIGASIADRVGRRTLWLYGTGCASATLAFAAAFTAKSESKPAVAFLLLFSFVVQGTYIPLQGKHVSFGVLEFSDPIKGPSFVRCLLPCTSSTGPHFRFALIESLAAVVNNFAGAVAFQKIGWKFILAFAVWCALETIVVWYCAVETKGRTLEELDEIFENPHPISASLNRRSGGTPEC